MLGATGKSDVFMIHQVLLDNHEAVLRGKKTGHYQYQHKDAFWSCFAYWDQGLHGRVALLDFFKVSTNMNSKLAGCLHRSALNWFSENPTSPNLKLPEVFTATWIMVSSGTGIVTLWNCHCVTEFRICSANYTYRFCRILYKEERRGRATPRIGEY